MTKLRLGPIVDDKPVKVTIEIDSGLLRDLGDYARVHAKANNLPEPMSPEKLIAPMVARFMASDREFGKLRRRS